jgi:hypothetical protein
MHYYSRPIKDKLCYARRQHRSIVTGLCLASPDTPTTMIPQLEQFADKIEFRYAGEMKTIMLVAADTIRFLQLMLGIKRETLDGTL